MEDNIKNNEPVSYVVGPLGTILTSADLPSTNIKRWTFYRKAEILAAVRGGFDNACERYSLTAEEFISWQEPIR